MSRKIIVFTVMIIVVMFLTGCQYHFPADSKTNPHTYDEALSYIQDYLDRDDVILSEETESGESEYGYQYTNYFARVDDIDFIVTSQERCHYDRTGEFCKIRYNLNNNYNYEKIHMLLANNQDYPSFELILETNLYLHIYNTTYFNYKHIIKNEDDLVKAFNESKTMYEWMITLYASPRYCVKMQIENSDRTLYVCAHKSKSNDSDFGFSQAKFEEIIDEYRRFYT